MRLKSPSPDRWLSQRRRFHIRAFAGFFWPLALESLEPRILLATDTRAAAISLGDPQIGEGASAEVQYTVRALAPGTNTPITTVLKDHDFDLQVSVRDLRSKPFTDSPRGVYAAYTDLLYDKSLAKVRVAEVQSVFLDTGATTTGSFTLSLNGQTTTSIPYDVVNTTAAEIAANIQAKLGALPTIGGAGNIVVVAPNPAEYSWTVKFVGAYDVDEPLIQANATSGATINVVELVKGDPTSTSSFTEAFRSTAIPGLAGLPTAPGPFQNGLAASDASDRLDDVGGSAGSTPIGTSSYELVRVRMKATLPANQSSGTLAFTPDFSQLLLPAHASLVYADLRTNPPESQNVAIDAITAVAATLSVQTALVATAGSAQFDEDTAAGVNIPILPLVTKSVIAPAGAIELRSFAQPVSGGTVTRYDPNNTPGDLSDDQVKFIPASNFNGTVTFTYTAGIVGDTNASDVAANTVTVTVNAVNDAPVNAVPGPQNTPEDTPLVFSAAGGNTFNIADVDAGSANLQTTLAVTGGTLTLSGTTGLAFSAGDGTADATMAFTGTLAAINTALAGMSFSPGQNSVAAVILTIVTDDQGNAGSGGAKQDQDTVSISITPVNDAPVVTVPAAQFVYSVNTLTFSPAVGNAISVADVDAASDSMSALITASGGIGTLGATAASGALVAGNGSSSLTITGSQTAITATLVGLTLTPPPSAASGAITIAANDLGHNPGPAQSSQGTINVTVLQAVGPFAVNDTPAGLLEGAASYLIDLLANDLANSPAKPTLVSFTQPTLGAVTRSDNGTPSDLTDDKLIYTPPLKNGLPDLDFFTPTSQPPITFTYIANEAPSSGSPNSPPGTVTIRIANVADPPLAASDGLVVGNKYITATGQTLAKTAAQGLLANDTVIDNSYGDPNVAALSVLGATQATALVASTTGGGSATVSVDGSFAYFPAAGYSGDDTFTYRTHSSLGPDSSVATVTIHVSSPPTAANDVVPDAQEDQPGGYVSANSVLANDADPSDGEPLTAVLVANAPASAGSVTLNPSGFFTYSPAPDFNTTRPPAAPITFTYKALAPSGRESNTATVSITVNETNDNPTAVGDTFVASEGGVDQEVTGLLANDSIAPDFGEVLTVSGIKGSAGNFGTGSATTTLGGSVRLVIDPVDPTKNKVRYTSPPGGIFGSDSFAYQISDGRGGVASAVVQVQVVPPYDYGDAADSYGTTAASDGPRHVAIGPLLGQLRDTEVDGVPTALANGDDLAGTDDEDGLLSYSLVRGKASSMTISVVATAGSAMLDAWIDFNHDGTFTANERISDHLTVPQGTSQLNLTPPTAALIGPTTARFRISSAGVAGSTGLAPDGEVEDHLVNVYQDLTVNLPTGNGLDLVSIRKNGANVEVFDMVSTPPIATSPLAYTRSVIVNGSASEPDSISVDYALGGFFALPGGIRLDGGASGGDLVDVEGAAGGTTSVRYTLPGAALGNATLETLDSGLQNNIQLANFEPLTINNVSTFESAGVMNVGADTLTVAAASPLKLGNLTTLLGGTINAFSGVALASGQILSGQGTVNGRIGADNGSIIEATGPLTLGDAASPDAFDTRGELRTNGNNVTLLDAGQASLGSLTKLGIAGVPGTLTAANGLLIAAGRQITGFGTLNTPNDSLRPVTNNGVIQGSSATERITLPGFVAGTGSLDNVTVTGTLSPEASPAVVSYGSVRFAATAKLIAEVGGTSPGSYDQLKFWGLAELGGNLEIKLIATPGLAIGDTYQLLVTSGGSSGTFASTTLPAVTSERKWYLAGTSGEVRLNLLSTHPWHNLGDAYNGRDVNDDGHVVAGDALAIINYINAFGNGPTLGAVPANVAYAKPFLDVIADNFIVAGDALDIINFINAGFGGEGESTAATSLSQPAAVASADASSDLSDLISLLAYDAANAAQRKRQAVNR